MFIPRGKTIYENLATSYVLVDALVGDLCEGGFSGVVEVVLRETEDYIVIVRGQVASVVEMQNGEHRNADAIRQTRRTVAQVAEQSRRERGRVAVYAHSAETAKAVAGRMNAQALYRGLSTEFTDLQKMMLKLAREKDRHWFIEVNTKSGPIGLIHMRAGHWRMINSSRGASEGESETVDVASNMALGELLEECDRENGTFDVYFERPQERVQGESRTVASEPIGLPAVEGRLGATASHVERAGTTQQAFNESNGGAKRFEPPAFSGLKEPTVELTENSWNSATDFSTQVSPPALTEVPPPHDSDRLSGAGGASSETPTEDEPFQRNGLRVSGKYEEMTEVKRLLGEIARSIEEAVQAVAQHDAFSMSFRAGQLRIAEQYPFLDPFRGEFEYLGGEIVFVGEATVEEFIAGLTEALKLAVEAVSRTNAYADRLRAYVIEDLQKLLARNRSQYESFGLDQAIEQIVAAQHPR